MTPDDKRLILGALLIGSLVWLAHGIAHGRVIDAESFGLGVVLPPLAGAVTIFAMWAWNREKTVEKPPKDDTIGTGGNQK